MAADPNQPPDPCAHHPMWADRWCVMRRWWSVRCGVVGILILTGLPALSDQFPNIAPSLIAWFPRNGAQCVPILGAAIAIVARIVSQEYIASLIRKKFHSQGDSDAQ